MDQRRGGTLRVDCLVSTAIDAVQEGHPALARELLLQALAEDPGNEVARLWLMRVLDHSGDGVRPAQEEHPARAQRSVRQGPAARLVRVAMRKALAVVAVAFLAGVALAESLTTFADPRLGLAMHCLLLGGLLFASTRVRDRQAWAFLVSLAFAPVIRILSLSLPLTHFPVLYWYLITGVPLFVAVWVAGRSLGYSWRALGLTLRGWPLQVVVGLSGLAFGAVEYYILRSEPLAPALSWAAIWQPALILLVCTGLLEEMIFRGLMQRAAGDALGRWGMPYVALLFAALHIGYRSLLDVLFVLGVGLFFGWIVDRSRSLLGVSLAHGLTNVMLFLIIPFLGV